VANIQWKIDKLIGYCRKEHKGYNTLRNELERDLVTKYSASLMKEKKPRDLITHLRVGTYPHTGKARFSHHSNEMAEHACTYHESLQQDPSETDQAQKDADIDEVKQNENIPSDEQKPTFNVIKFLTMVFNDIEMHCLIKDSDFNIGWMCPIFKKKKCTEIANYCPITVLNSDYKLFTKALTVKLLQVAPSIIHSDQAGFMPQC
jgi:hypothetical protein